MATFRPEKMTDATVAGLRWSGKQDRYRDPKTGLYAVVNRTGVSFGMELHSKGKSKWVTLGRFVPGSYGVAQARKDAIAQMAEVGAKGLQSRQKTFKDAFERLKLRHVREKKQPRTIEGYEAVIELHSPEIWAMPLTDIRKGWLKQKREDIMDEIGGPTSTNWLRAVSPALTEAAELEWIEANHAKGIRLPTTAKPVEVNREDVKKLWGQIEQISNVWMRSAWRLGLLTGLRKNDIATAAWEHFDADAGTLFLPEPKGGKKRAFTLPLPKFIVDDLSRLPRLAGECAPWIFPAPRSKTGHIYDHRQPDLPNPHYARHCWSTMAEKAGVDEWRRAVLLNQQPGRGINARYTHSKAVDYREEMELAAEYILALRKDG